MDKNFESAEVFESLYVVYMERVYQTSRKSKFCIKLDIDILFKLVSDI